MNIDKNVPLAPYTTFGIGGSADYFYKADSTKALIDAVHWASTANLPFFVLGSGANILIGDKGFRGLVIKNESSRYQFSEKVDNGVFLTAESGITIAELITSTVKQGLSGFEHFAGIPSTLGGALWQNLHFLSPDRSQTIFIGDMVKEAIIYKLLDDRIAVVPRDYFRFSYDYSILHDTHDIVLSATLRLTKEDFKIIQKRIDANLAWRAEKHPENAAKTSAGSVFKKIARQGAGRLIEKVGLKGYQIGGAKISEKHANFIINTGNATATDVHSLIALVQKTVKEQLGWHLETEISFIGEF